MSHTHSSDMVGRLWHAATWQWCHTDSNNRICFCPSTNCLCRVYQCIYSVCSAEAAHPLPLRPVPWCCTFVQYCTYSLLSPQPLALLLVCTTHLWWIRATALLRGNNHDIDAATFSERVSCNDDRMQVEGRFCAHQGTPNKDKRLAAKYCITLQ